MEISLFLWYIVRNGGGTMENIINKMLERINFKIRYAHENFTEWNESHSLRMAEIDGMIDMLSIVTGKDYIITEDGLKEK